MPYITGFTSMQSYHSQKLTRNRGNMTPVSAQPTLKVGRVLVFDIKTPLHDL